MSDEDRIPTGLGLTALREGFRGNPYPILDILRERDPVHDETLALAEEEVVRRKLPVFQGCERLMIKTG